MNMTINSAFLKEMGITEWHSREASPKTNQAILATEVVSQQTVDPVIETQLVAATDTNTVSGIWWFLVKNPKVMQNYSF